MSVPPLLFVFAIAFGADDPAKPVSADDSAFFETRIRPVLTDHCVSCHGPDKSKAGLRLDRRSDAIKGASSGPVIVPGDPEASPLIEAVRHTGDTKMPPKSKLPDSAIQDLTEWVKRGAPWPESPSAKPDPAETHWSFQPISNPPVPPVADEAWARSTIDRFLMAKLESKGLKPSKPADKLTLIRRATFDLIGLPPTPQEVAAFEADTSPNAFETLVDRLLASPHYGERWGRHWLDVARYADTKGYVFTEEPNYPWAWAYRDWVVRAINEDLPYDQFIIQQIAADRLPLGDDKRALAAMGFLTVGSRFMNNVQDQVDDRIDVVTRGVMGLTVSCARCHDHKFDPIPTADYYSLYGVFASSKEPTLPPLFGPPPKTPQFEAFTKELAAREAKLTAFVHEKHDAVIAQAKARVGDYLLAANKAGDQPDTSEFMQISEGGDLNPVVLQRWRSYVRGTKSSHHPIFAPWHELASFPKEGFADRARSRIDGWSAHPDSSKPINPVILRSLAANPPATLADVARVYAQTLNGVEGMWVDYSLRSVLNGSPATSLPDPAHEALRLVFHAPDAPPDVPFNPIGGLAILPDRASQGQFSERLKAVETYRVSGPGAPPRAMVLEDTKKPVEPRIFRRGNPGTPGDAVPRRFLKVISGASRTPFADGSGRSDLARAIASADNPLTSRVAVNRVWMHHFGKPIVGTPSDFGMRGDPPTHPELLDHLARTFVADGWSIKRLHKRIMLSAAYMQSSDDRPEARAIDPENALLWRMNRRRLDFEATRDALAAVSGRLDPTIGGPSVEDLFAAGPSRRTLYGKIDRLRLPGVYRAFDYPDPATSNPKRDRTTVAPQALFLMNHPFAIACAENVLKRPEVAGQADLSRKVDRVYHLLYGRGPNPAEIQLAQEYLAGASPEDWVRYVQGLLMSNEFVFVD